MRVPLRPALTTLTLATILAASIPASAAHPTFQEATPGDFAPGEVLVGFREDANSGARRAVLGTVAGIVDESRPALGYQRVRLPQGASVPDAVRRLRESPDVVWVEPNYYAYAFGAPFCPQDPWLEDDGDSTNQWGVFQTNLPGLWRMGYGGGDPGVKLAIVDSGIDDWGSPHPDLAANLDSLGYDAVDGDSVPTDLGANKGHGTAVAGVAAAVSDTVGIAGVAYCSTIQVVRVMDCSAPETCTGTVDDIAEGIEWAALNGADVINLSLGTSFYSQAMRNAVLNAIALDVIVVAATGNDGASTIAFPADYPEVIAVGASDSTGGVWSGSNYGANLDVVAPGAAILAPNAVGTYKTRTGTSLAAPFVSGLAALLKAQNESITHLEAKDWINAHTQPTSDPAKDGNGEVAFLAPSDFSDGQGVPPVGHSSFVWEWLGDDVTPESSDIDPMDFDGRPNVDGPDPGHGDAGDDGVFPGSFPKFPFAPDRWDGADDVAVTMTVSDHLGPRYGAAAAKNVYIDQFIDWNLDGTFSVAASDSEHTIAGHAENPAMWPGHQFVATLPISVPNHHILGLPLNIRTRLAYGSPAGVTTVVPYGEVEDMRVDNFVEDFDTAFYVAPDTAPYPAMGLWGIAPDPDPMTGASNHGTWEWAKAPHPIPGDECTGAIETSDPMALPPMFWEEYTAASINFDYNHNVQPCGPVGMDACKMVVFLGGSPVLTTPIPMGSGEMTVGLGAYTGTPAPVDIAFIAETDNPGWLYIDDVRVVAFDEDPPAAIGDLAATRAAGSRAVTASWTAPHESFVFPGKEGTADSYQVRYWQNPITSVADFLNAVPVLPGDLVGPLPVPAAPGTPQMVTFNVPSAHESYHVAVRAGDEVLNITPLSNVPLEATTATDGVAVTSVLGSGTIIVAAPGDSVDADFKFDNTGNAEDLLVVEAIGDVQGWSGYADEGGVDRPSPVGLTLGAGGSATLTLGIDVPTVVPDSTMEVLVASAQSTNGASSARDSVFVLVVSSPVDAPELPAAVLPVTAALEFAGPNPTRGGSSFRLALTRAQPVRADVYNVKGERVRRLIDGGMEPGIHEVRWDGTSDSRGPVPSGIYFLRLACDELVETRQIVRLR